MGTDYVHGYTEAETRRLAIRRARWPSLLHGDTQYEAGSRVLEVGCGVGAQTVQLRHQQPGHRADLGRHLRGLARRGANAASPRERRRGRSSGITATCTNLPYAEFDHLFVCFVLEHLPDPVEALRTLQPSSARAARSRSIEGDHGSAFYHPRSDAQHVIECLIDLQEEAGGDALIGRRVQPLLNAAGFDDVLTEPRTVYADQTVPHLVDGFTRRTFIAMVGSVRDRSIAAGLSTPDAWERGIRDLKRAAEPGGTFHYTFFKAVGGRPDRAARPRRRGDRRARLQTAAAGAPAAYGSTPTGRRDRDRDRRWGDLRADEDRACRRLVKLGDAADRAARDRDQVRRRRARDSAGVARAARRRGSRNRSSSRWRPCTSTPPSCTSPRTR